MTTPSLKFHFLLNEDITFLNFGSFGASPKPVFERYQVYQLEMERDPVQFMTVRLGQYLKNSREALSTYISCNADDVVMVLNPSYAVNTIAKSIKWQVGAKYIRQPIQLPLIKFRKLEKLKMTMPIYWHYFLKY